MPKREDEFWTNGNEPKGKGLCPFCGSSTLYWNKLYRTWRCGRCEKSFPSPSYGSGKDFGKDDRAERIREITEAARVVRAAKARKSTASSLGIRKPILSITKFLLCLLVIVGIGVLARTGYLLFIHNDFSAKDIVIFVVELGLWFWLISILRSGRFRYRKPNFKPVFVFTIAISLICAYVGIEPFSSTKDQATSIIEQNWETITKSSQSPVPTPVQPAPDKPTITPVLSPTPVNTASNPTRATCPIHTRTHK